MKPIKFDPHEATIILLALDITEQAWVMHNLLGHTNPQTDTSKAAVERIRLKIGAAGTPEWDGRPAGDEDDLGFVPDSMRDK